MFEYESSIFALQCPYLRPSDSRNGCGIARSIGYTPGFKPKISSKASYEGKTKNLNDY